LDLAVATELADDVPILLGKGDGAFEPSIRFAAGTAAYAMGAADFNGDGKPDVAVANSPLTNEHNGYVPVVTNTTP
jgi:hypothetical protein